MFDLSQYPRGARALFEKGAVYWPSAVLEAVDGGVRDVADLADLAFFMNHPERVSGDRARPLQAGESDFERLADEWKAYHALAAPVAQARPGRRSASGRPGAVVDRTGEHVLKKGFASPARRPEQITGIVLHQTGVAMSEDPARWDGVAAHVGVMADGRVVHINSIRSYVMHGNRANAFSLGVEIHGLLPGLAGDWRTMPAASKKRHPDLSFRQRQKVNFDRRTRVTPALVRGAREALAFLADEALSLGCPLAYLWAHRQFDRSRSADPGEALWKQVALWALDELGLEQDPNFTLGSGRAVPREWGVPESAFDYRNREIEEPTPPRATMRRVRGINSRKRLGNLTIPT